MDKSAEPSWPGYVCTCALLIHLTGWGIVAYQIYFWLQNGEWQRFSVEDLFVSLELLPTPADGFYSSSWYYFPNSWIGINKIIVSVLQKTPSSLFIIISSIMIFYYVAVKNDRGEFRPIFSKK